MNETNETLNRIYQKLLQNINDEPYCNRVLRTVKKEFGVDWEKEINNFRLKSTNDINTSGKGKRKHLKQTDVKKEKRKRHSLSSLKLKLKVSESSNKHIIGINDIYHLETFDLDLIVDYIEDIKKLNSKYHHFERMASLTRHILKKIEGIDEIKTINAMFVVRKTTLRREVKEWVFYTADHPYVVILDLNIPPPSEYYTGPTISRKQRVFSDDDQHDFWILFFEQVINKEVVKQIKPILLNPLVISKGIIDYTRYLISEFGFKVIHPKVGKQSTLIYTLTPRTRTVWFLPAEKLYKNYNLGKHAKVMYYFENSTEDFGNIIRCYFSPFLFGAIYNNFFLRELILNPENLSRDYNINDHTLKQLKSYLSLEVIKDKVLYEGKNLWNMTYTKHHITCYILIDAWIAIGNVDSSKNKLTIETYDIHVKKFNYRGFLYLKVIYKYIDGQNVLYKLSNKNEEKILRKTNIDMNGIYKINSMLITVSNTLYNIMMLSPDKLTLMFGNRFGKDKEINKISVDWGRVMFFTFDYLEERIYEHLGKQILTVGMFLWVS